MELTPASVREAPISQLKENLVKILRRGELAKALETRDFETPIITLDELIKSINDHYYFFDQQTFSEEIENERSDTYTTQKSWYRLLERVSKYQAVWINLIHLLSSEDQQVIKVSYDSFQKLVKILEDLVLGYKYIEEEQVDPKIVDFLEKSDLIQFGLAEKAFENLPDKDLETALNDFDPIFQAHYLNKVGQQDGSNPRKAFEEASAEWIATKKLEGRLNQSYSKGVPTFVLEGIVPTYHNKKNQTLLMLAVPHGDLALVRHLINAGVNLDAQDSHGATALSIAVKHGHRALVEELLDLGAHILPDSKGRGPLHIALIDQNELTYTLVDLLLEKGRADPNSPDQNGYTPLHYALYYSKTGDPYDYENGDDYDDLEDEEDISSFSGGAGPQGVDDSDESLVERLIRGGASIIQPDYKGRSALFHVQLDDDLQVLLAHLPSDFNLDLVDNEREPLLHSLIRRDIRELPEVTERLINGGYPLEREDSSGMTPLLRAVWFTRVDLVPVLIKLGANVNHLNSAGEDVFEMLDQEGILGQIEAIIYYLLEAGAIPSVKLLGQSKYVGILADYLALKNYDHMELVAKRDQPPLPSPLDDLVQQDKHGVFFQPTEMIREGLDYLERFTSSGTKSEFRYFEKMPYRSRMGRPFNCSEDCRKQVPKLENMIIFDTRRELASLERELEQRQKQHGSEKPFLLRQVTDLAQLSEIYRLFVAPTGDPYPFKILEVYRIENPRLENQFAHRENPSENVVSLWHGSNKENLFSVLTKGYRMHGDPGYITATDTWFGKGVYFAPEAYKSTWYSNRIRDECKRYPGDSELTAYVILNLVDLGNEETIWRVPPMEKLEERAIPDGYTSVYVHGGQGYFETTGVNRDEVVINKKDRILPTYLVKVGCMNSGHQGLLDRYAGLPSQIKSDSSSSRGPSLPGD